MSSLILDSLEIKNFRAFRHLQIERLGQVNLIVGQNNIGKTCLLEALWLYASRSSPEVMQQILANRNEFALIGDDKNRASAIKYLFYGREEIENVTTGAIEIGSISNDDTIFIGTLFVPKDMSENVSWLSSKTGIDIVSFVNEVTNKKGSHRNTLYNFFGIDTSSLSTRRLSIFKKKIRDNRNTLLILSGSPEQIIKIDKSFTQVSITQPTVEIPTQFIPYRGVDQKHVTEWWDSTYLTESEDNVLAALHIIEPKIRRIGLVENRQQKGERVPMVRLAGEKSPVLLSSLGQGMNHLFALALALVNAKDGFLLIDEVENGIYHGTQSDLWGFIFKMARRLNVQVFATTHSRDSLEAFQEALEQDQETDGLLISLRSKQGKLGEVVGVLFERENLAIVTDQQIEVR